MLCSFNPLYSVMWKLFELWVLFIDYTPDMNIETTFHIPTVNSQHSCRMFSYLTAMFVSKDKFMVLKLTCTLMDAVILLSAHVSSQNQVRIVVC